MEYKTFLFVTKDMNLFEYSVDTLHGRPQNTVDLLVHQDTIPSKVEEISSDKTRQLERLRFHFETFGWRQPFYRYQTGMIVRSEDLVVTLELFHEEGINSLKLTNLIRTNPFVFLYADKKKIFTERPRRTPL